MINKPDGKALNNTASGSRLLDYERLLEAETISKAIYTLPDESVLIRNAFRWKLNGKVVSNAYECHSMEQVCEDRGWRIVAKYGDHIAIISENDQGKARR